MVMKGLSRQVGDESPYLRGGAFVDIAAPLGQGLLDAGDSEGQRYRQTMLLEPGSPMGQKLNFYLAMTTDQLLGFSVEQCGNMSIDDAKFYNKAIRVAMRAKDKNAELCVRGLLSLKRVVELSPPGCDFFAAVALNEFFEAGTLDGPPDLVMEILELCVKNCKDGRGRHRHEVFDAYCRFAGYDSAKMQRFIDFMLKNIDCLVDMDLSDSKNIDGVLRFVEGGDQLRIEIARKRFSKGVGRWSSSAISDTMWQNYVEGVLIAYDGDYLQAARVLNKKIPCSPKAKERMRDSLEALIPPASTFGNDLDQLDDGMLPDEMRARFGDNIKVATSGFGMRQAVKRDDHDIAFDVLLSDAKDPKKSWQDCYGVFCVYLQKFLDVENISAEVMLERCNDLLLADNEGRIKIPLDFASIIVARYLEALYKTGDLRLLIENGLKMERVHGFRLIRGAVYYLVKAFFDLRDSINPDQVEEIESLVMGFAKRELPQFQGTQWQEELLVSHFLPEYLRYGEVVRGGGVSLKVLNDVVEKNPENDLFKIVRLDMADGRGNVVPICARANAVSGLDEGWERLRGEANARVIKSLREAGKDLQLIDVLYTIPHYEGHVNLSEILVASLLKPGIVNQARYAEAERLIALWPELGEKFSGQILAARKILKIVETVEVEPLDYLREALESDGFIKRLLAEDQVRAAYLAAQLKELAEFYVDDIRSVGGVDFSKLGDAKSPQYGALKAYCGIEELYFERKCGGIEVVCLLPKTKGQDDLTKRIVKFDLDRNFKLGDLQIESGADDEAGVKVQYRLLHVALLEEIKRRLDGEEYNMCLETVHGEDSGLDELRAKREAYFVDQNPFKVELKGMEGLQERNEKVLAEIMKSYSNMARSINFPSDEELQGLIMRYAELIGACRDLDRPITYFDAAVDHKNPMFSHVKYLRIFGDRAGEMALADEGVDYRRSERKGNFEGYYELRCYFKDLPGTGEVPVHVFLDNTGKAHIPGIDATHPLYLHLWMMTLEALALKVVPEVRPFSHVFNRKEPRAGEGADKSVGRHKDSAMAVRRRISCAVLVTASCASGNSDENHTEGKLKLLDEITEAFNILNLSELGITQWPLYIAKSIGSHSKEFVSVEGLFVKREGKNFLDMRKFAEIFEVAESGEELLEIEVLNQDVRASLDKLKLQVLSGRAYRLPVNFVPSTHQIVERDGVEYSLISAKNRRGTVEEINGKLYRLKAVPVHAKVDIGGKLFFAIPWQMSELQRGVYDRKARVEIDFTPKPVKYAVLYSTVDREVLAYIHLGSPDGEAARVYEQSHNAGELAMMRDPKIANQFCARDDLAEVFVDVESNIGYKQGAFVSLFRYLAEQRDEEEMALRLLIDGMKGKIGAVQAGELAEKLRSEPVEPAKKKRVRVKDGDEEPDPRVVEERARNMLNESRYVGARQRTVSALVAGRDIDAQAVYEVLSSDYEGLRGMRFNILGENDPLYSYYFDVLKPGDGKVMIVSTRGVNVVPRKLLVNVKKRSD